ncbi:hypothetical protein MMC14_001137 [Varicellaria rhodocarpa]|nr:hypothetical protein [Varicellaria rhodocarpa]
MSVHSRLESTLQKLQPNRPSQSQSLLLQAQSQLSTEEVYNVTTSEITNKPSGGAEFAVRRSWDNRLNPPKSARCFDRWIETSSLSQVTTEAYLMLAERATFSNRTKYTLEESKSLWDFERHQYEELRDMWKIRRSASSRI